MPFRDIKEIIATLRTRSPLAFLILLNLAMTLSFASWQLLVNNFAVQKAGLDGAQYGLLQSVREIPGFLAFLVVYLILFINEQRLALIALLMLGFAVALTGLMPSFWGLIFTTFVSSIGFHYYETVNQSLQLQWLPKDKAPHQIGLIIGASSLLTFFIYLIFAVLWVPLNMRFDVTYIVVGLATMILVFIAARRFREFPEASVQNPGIVLRKRYWLFYMLQFLAGARRQIFVVFAGFMMVERFHFSVSWMSVLALITFLSSAFLSPVVGRMIIRFGERNTLLVEYGGLTLIFGAYMGIYLFDWPAWVGAGLYVLDHVFFAMHIAMKTYFQKIADAEDMASTAAVSFTINHIAAVFLPALLGLLWLQSPSWVFGLAMGLAICSFSMALLVPRAPSKGRETVWTGGLAEV